MSNKLKLTKPEQALLQAVFDHFDKTGGWPNNRKIYIAFRDKVNLWELSKRLGWNIIRTGEPRDQNSDVALTVEGMAACKGSETILEIFVQVIKYAIKQLLDEPQTPKIKSPLIRLELGLNDIQCKQIYAFFVNERGLYTGASYDNERQNYEINLPLEILRYEKIKDINDYINIVREERRKFEQAVDNLEYPSTLYSKQETVVFDPLIKGKILNLISNPGLKAIIAQDLNEIETGFNAKSWKSISLLCGSVCEGLLWNLIDQAKIDNAKGKMPNEDSDLYELVKFAVENNIINRRVERSSDVIRLTRNMIHPCIAMKDGTVTETGAKASYISLEVVVEAVENSKNAD
jgi:hypothetical protein